MYRLLQFRNVFALGLCLAVMLGSCALAQRPNPVAAKILETASEVTWETGLGKEVKIGILSATDDVARTLPAALEEAKLKARGVAVSRFNELAPDISDMDVLYVGRDFTEQLPRIRAAVAGDSVLLIGLQGDFREKGGMIELVVRGVHLKHDIHTERMLAEKLRPSVTLRRGAGRK